MSISYLSKPLQSEVRPFQENIDLISKVSAYKQSRYDKVVDTMLQKQNNLLNIDVSFAPTEVQQEKDNLLKEADKQLDALSKVDLLNPENINKAEAIFEPITNNDKIILGAQFTKQVRENQSLYDEWRKKKPEFYNSANEAYSMQEASKAKNMSFKDFKENYQNFDIQAIQFRDIDKEFREAAKTLGITYKGYTQMKDGLYIMTEERGILKAEDVMNILPNDAGILAQAKVNAWASMGNVTKEDLLQGQLKINQTKIKETKDVIALTGDELKAIDKNIKLLNSNDPSAQSTFKTLFGDKLPNLDIKNEEHKKVILQYLEKQKDVYTKSLVENQKQLDNNFEEENQLKAYFNSDFTERQLLDLKTQFYLQSKKMDYGQAFSKDERSIKIDVDKEAEMKLKYDYDVGLENVKTQNEIRKDYFESLYGGNGSSSNNGGTSTTKVTNDITPLSPAESQDSEEKKDMSRSSMISQQLDIQSQIGGELKTENGKKVFYFSKYGEGTKMYNDVLKNRVPNSYVNNISSYSGLQEVQKEFQKQIDTYENILSKREKDDKNNGLYTPNQTYEQALETIPEDVKAYVEQRSLLKSTLQQNIALLNKATKVAKSDILSKKSLIDVSIPLQSYELEKSFLLSNGLPLKTENNYRTSQSLPLNFKLKINPVYINKNGVSKQDVAKILEDNGFKNITEFTINKFFSKINSDLNIRGETLQINNDLEEKTNDILKEYTMTKKDTPYYATNLKEGTPQYKFVEDAKGFVMASDASLSGKNIEIKSFKPSDNGWKVVYSYNAKNAAGTEKPVITEKPLNSQFVQRWSSFLKSAPTVELYNIMQSQHIYNKSGKTYSNSNEVINSQPFVYNGEKYKFVINSDTPEGKVLLFKRNMNAPISEGLEVTLNEALAIMEGKDLGGSYSQKLTPEQLELLLQKTFQK